MAYTRICTTDDLWEGEMNAYEIDGHELVVVCIEGGAIRAYQGACPHQDIPLVEGKFDGKHLICRAHQWIFDACTGEGINPGGCKLASYPIRIDGNEVHVDPDGVTPLFARA